MFCTNWRRVGEQRRAQVVRIADDGAVGQRAQHVDLGARKPVDGAGLADGVESSSDEAERIDDAMAGEALRLLRDAASSRSRVVVAFTPASFSVSAGTVGGGAGGGVPMIRSRIQAPRSTGDVRFG